MSSFYELQLKVPVFPSRHGYAALKTCSLCSVNSLWSGHGNELGKVGYVLCRVQLRDFVFLFSFHGTGMLRLRDG